VRGAVILLILLGIAAGWKWTPLSRWIDFNTILSWETSFKKSVAAPYVIVAAYVIGGFVLFPVTLLTVATVFTFGLLPGYLYALAGCLTSATLTYAMGRMLSRDLVRRIAGSRMDRFRRKGTQHGLITVFMIRIVPIAPFTIVNMIMGASGIGLRDFIVGSLLGMTPGLLALTLFGFQLDYALRSPGTSGFVLLGITVVLVALASIGVRRWLSRASGLSESKSLSEDEQWLISKTRFRNKKDF
jgi:uncharacterized membrane protein YdjX (TVP38/TMEM64 family)